MSHKNTLMAPELIKRKCLFQSVLYKSRNTVLHVELEPSTHVEPCAETANRRKTSNRLRGRELLPGLAPKPDFYTFTCIALCEGFGVDKLSWDPFLKGSFYRVQLSRDRKIRQPPEDSSETVHS